MSENFRDLCTEYINELDREFDHGEIEVLEERVSELQEERQKYVHDYGEDDVLVERVDGDLEELNAKLNRKEEIINKSEELEDKILRKTPSEFIADGVYLSQPVLESLSHILTGKRRDSLRVEDYEITSDTELETDIRRVSHVIRKLALTKLGEDDSVQESWKRIVDGKRLPPFLVVANAQEPLPPSEVAKRMDSDVDSGKVGNNLRNAIHKLEYPPYHRIDGDYTLSTVGELMFLEYGDGLEEPFRSDSVDPDEGAGDEDQSTLGVKKND